MFYSFLDIKYILISYPILFLTLYFFSKPKKFIKNENYKKTILITGCDSGFGKGLVQSASLAGFKVIAACYTEKGAKELISYRNVLIVIADLSQEAGIKKVVNFTKNIVQNSGLFALVNNAGICLPGNVDWLPEKSYKQTMDINFHAPVNLTYNLLEFIKKAKGRILNVTSVDGFISLPTNAAYCSSKHALEAYSDALRCEMIPWDVKVVVVQPSTMRTPLATNFADAWLKSFENADKDKQLLYGSDWAKFIAKKTKDGIQALAADPDETVSAMLNILQHQNPPARVKTGKSAIFLFKPLSLLPDFIRDRMLYSMTFGGASFQSQKKPPNNVVSHLTIQVSNLQNSIDWYSTFGFVCVGESINGKQFLKGGNHAKWQPLILLSENKDMVKRGESYDAGMTRLSLCTTSIDKDIAHLSKNNIQPMAKPVDNNSGKIAAYKDPDGFVVYLVSFGFSLSLFLSGVRMWYKVSNPSIFSSTFNVTNYEKYIEILEKIGFNKKIYEMGHELKNKPIYSLLSSFNISTTETIIKHIKMITLPSDFFGITVMEWTKPRTEHKGAEKLNKLSISVKDVYFEMDRLKKLGMNTFTTKIETLPIYGEILIGRVEVDGAIIELCEF